jgi:hypothetical protein
VLQFSNDIRWMRLSHGLSKVPASLTSRAGPVAVVVLAERAGLLAVTRDHGIVPKAWAPADF